MKSIKSFKSFKSFKLNETILYRGTNYPLDFQKNNTTFFSEEESFAKEYGDNVYRLEVDLGKIFDTTNEDDLNIIFKEFDHLIDEYDGTIYTKSDIFKIIRSSDTWEMFEKTYGVLKWLENNYNSVKITEGGEVNYIVFDAKQRIKNYEILSESYLHENKQNVGYELVEDMNTFYYLNRQKFSEKEFKKISDFLTTLPDENLFSPKNCSAVLKNDDDKIDFRYHKNGNNTLIICKDDDDYYYCGLNNEGKITLHKCDSIDGLLEFLEIEGNIFKPIAWGEYYRSRRNAHNESVKQDLYIEISIDELIDNVGRPKFTHKIDINRYPFTNGEFKLISNIRDYLPKGNIFSSKRSTYNISDPTTIKLDNEEDLICIYHIVSSYQKNRICKIYKSEDDYYYSVIIINKNSRYFKCDSIDGIEEMFIKEGEK